MDRGTFIDVGAFIGRHSIRLAKNQNVRVIAIEPNPISLKILKENILLNKVDKKIEIVPAALVSDESETEILMELNHGRSKITSYNNNLTPSLTKVKTITFKKLLSELRINTDNKLLMKIDIEGYEDTLLRSMREFFITASSNFELVCEILHNSPHREETLKYLRSLNFNILQVDSENYYIYKN